MCDLLNCDERDVTGDCRRTSGLVQGIRATGFSRISHHTDRLAARRFETGACRRPAPRIKDNNAMFLILRKSSGMFCRLRWTAIWTVPMRTAEKKRGENSRGKMILSFVYYSMGSSSRLYVAAFAIKSQSLSNLFPIYLYRFRQKRDVR